MTLTLPAPNAADEARPRAVPVERAAATARRVPADETLPDIVDVWGKDSFPASDAPANW
jgi:hypothetical protein